MNTDAVNQLPLLMTFGEFQAMKAEADKRMKASNGHYFVTILKTRCQFCGRSPKARGLCGFWFQTFLFELDSLLLNWKDEASGSTK
jgi:hypothetical protein